MASAEKCSSGNASQNFNAIFIKIVWLSTGNTIKNSVRFSLESSILHFKEGVSPPFCEEIAQVTACSTVLRLWPGVLVRPLAVY